MNRVYKRKGNIRINIPQRLPLLRRGPGGGKTKNPSSLDEGFSKERRRHTLPQIAVPSAQAGLTTLFGMGRGEPRRNNHLKVVLQWVIGYLPINIT